MEKRKQSVPSCEEEVFETAFSQFWESEECDHLNGVLYDLIKAAYAAGYRAAGKEPPKYRRKFCTAADKMEQ